MKKSNFQFILSMAVWWTFACAQLIAQSNVNLAANGNTVGSIFTIAPPTDHFFNFFDFGGAELNYNNGTNTSITFLPSNPATHRIQVSFNAFGLEAGFDAFYIFNSNTVGVNQIPGPQGATFSGFPAGNWQSINPGTVTANSGIASVGDNATGALSFQFRSDNSVSAAGWNAIVRQVPNANCTMTAPKTQTVNSGAGSTSSFVNVNTPLPTFSPIGSNVGYQLQYRINGGLPTVVSDASKTMIPTPVGENVIMWELIEPLGGGIIASGVQIIKVIDNTPPSITCPANTTINLQPGLQVSDKFSYQVSSTDNCMASKVGQVNQPVDFNNGQAGIMFDVSNLSSSILTLTEFGPSLDTGIWPIEIYYTTNLGSLSGLENLPIAWTLAGKHTVTSTGPAIGTPISGFAITIPAGETRGIYITSSTGVPINFTDGIRQTGDGILRVSSNQGVGNAYPFGTTFSKKSYNGYVKYAVPADNPVVQLSGIPSGGTYPIGTTTNVFSCTDASGNVATSSFTVTVQGMQADAGLICNDLLQVSLDINCTATLQADDILEGGPYIYANMIVEIDKTPPYLNGPWLPAVLGPADVGKSYGVRVRDFTNGEECTGQINVVDLLDPALDCTPTPFVLPCNFSTDPLFSDVVTMTMRFKATLPADNTANGGQTISVPIPVSLPLNATVQDVDVRVKISGPTFSGNLLIEAESPATTPVILWDHVNVPPCLLAPLFVQFDQQGTGFFTCSNYTTDQCAIPQNTPDLLSDFNGEQVNGNWVIRVSNDAGFNPAVIERVELLITMTGTFGAGFPNGVSPADVIPNGNQSYIVPAPLIDACSDVELTYIDTEFPQDCTTGLTTIIHRRWQATDASGNQATCIQQIDLLRPTLRDVTLPPDYDGIDPPFIVFDCSDAYPTPDWIEGQGLQGYPYVFNAIDGCNTIHSEFEDKAVWTCDGAYNINREWSIIDHCTGQFLLHTQIIRIIDNTGPTFIDCPTDFVKTTDPYDCCSSMYLPDVLVVDDCSRINNVKAQIIIRDPFTNVIINVIEVGGGLFNFPGNPANDPDTLASFNLTPCVPVGVHTVRYIAQDACGNIGTCEFELTVIDYAPPVAACDETTVVAIGKDDPNDCYYANFANCEFAGVTWVKATTFDDGSYDECSEVKFTIRRAAPYSDCINDLDGCEFSTATAELDSIKFYCCEVGTELMVILREYQCNIDGTISTYPDGTPIFNECQVKVQVQDKLRPLCETPFNVTVNCENFDPSLWTYGKPNVYDNCCLDTSYHYQGQKGLTHSVNYSLFDSVCNKGTITRTFKVYDCHGNSAQCTQRIFVTYEQDYFVKFPNDVIVYQCDGTGLYGEPQLFGEDCELLGINYEDQIFTVVPDACYKIERTWSIINWCTYNPNLDCIYVPNPNPHTNGNHVSNLPGPVVSACGTVGSWAPTVVKINPTDPVATNYCTFWDQNANCYKYKQIIKIIDSDGPIIVCPPSPQNFCDLTTNDPELWNESYWWDPRSQSHDLCEGNVDLNVSATDFCSGANLTIRYLLFLDLDGAGGMETVVSSTNPPAPGTVNYGNANTPNFSGGVPRQFDHRAVSPNQKYRFAVQTNVNGTSLGASVRLNTVASPATYVEPELPYGTHKIKWIASDGCGNESVCEYEFVVKDCKSPTIVCMNGLTGNLMQTGMISLFASDFLLHAEDNCTAADDLLFALKKCDDPTAGFPVDGNGNPSISLTFDCTELGTQCIELWAQDAFGNADYCETYMIIQDNGDNCGAGSATVAGLLKTEMSDGLEETDVELAGPTFNLFDMTDQEGQYTFSNAVPMHADYTITPTKDDNPLNGVTTYDLVLISKHILGVEPFTSPYKMIAADANRSGSITTFDMVELRKLILGIYTDLPENDSWRFVDKSFAFPNMANPFQTAFPETKTVADIQAHAMDDNFVAIKIGDVNSTAIANSLMSSDERTSSTLLFDVQDRTVKAGEVFEVKFKAAEKVVGYQFTLNYNDLELADIVPGPGMKADNFATFAGENALTSSFDGAQQAEFTLKFKAKKAGELNKMISVSSRITKAEGYQVNPAAEQTTRLDIALRFNGKEGSTINGVGFELYQNQPNPFVNRTLVGFHLPDAATATLSVFDQSGRLVFSQKGDFPKGYNSIPLEKSLLNTAGALFYKLETANDSATKTMIQLK
ncbi:MAG: T9SS type A sorting domain-containing protein [Lewinellaceae bacterium]|nr:T9SS type A sorting domain-containing protein [Lewinellaceae bacterium]